MATIYTLKRKTFALLANGGGKSISQFKAEFNAFKAKNPNSNLSFTEWYNGKNPEVVKMQASRAERMKGLGGSATSTTAYGAAGSTSALGKANEAIKSAEATKAATRNTIKSNQNLQNRIAEVGKSSRQAGYNAGLRAGQRSVSGATGAKTWVQNTWRSGAKGKAGLLLGGTALVAAPIIAHSAGKRAGQN